MSFTIKELENLSGIKAHTIRIWEQRYNFLKPSRTQTNIRTYNNDELKTLLTVALLNKWGYKISRIDEMRPEQRAEAVWKLNQPEAAMEAKVNELLGFMIDLRSFEFEQALNRHVQELGLEKTITTLVFQFLEKVGILWQTARIVPLQEHIVSCIIRQKIITGIESLPYVHATEPLVVLMLPEEEYHELGLLFVYYLLRRSGVPVIYLGANVPLRDVSVLFELKTPHYLYLHLTAFPRRQSFQKMLTQLSQQAPQCRIIVSGIVAQENKTEQFPNITFLQSLTQLQRFVASIGS